MKKRLEVTKKYIPELKVIQVEQKTTTKGNGSISLIEFKKPATADEKLVKKAVLLSFRKNVAKELSEMEAAQ